MFSQGAKYNNRLVDYSFIAGINQDEINHDDYTLTYTPLCLLGYPEDNQEQFSQVAAVVYPLDAKVLPKNHNEEDIISFYTTILTNEKGIRSYIYVLKMYDEFINFKTPIAICFCSTVNDTDSFKQLLNEIYMILSSDYSIMTKKIELMNYFMFVHSILIPPSHTLLNLNMRYMNVSLYFHSQSEIPTNLNDTSINILFSVLDVSKVIKLWLNVLRENKIIIYGNKPFLLNAIGEAITRLIFPFKWQHTYMSCLPKNQIDFLEAPCPYIFGILSSLMNIKDLCKDYAHACIVDLETGQIMAPKITPLPREELIALKKKIQYVKNPELYEEHELFKSDIKRKKTTTSAMTYGDGDLDTNDIDLNKPFSFNIQMIFFHILRKHLRNYKDFLINKEKDKFEEKRYLNSIKSQEMKILWAKIIKTNMFDYFIQYSHYKDESYNRIFDELCKEKSDMDGKGKNSTNATQITITLKPMNIVRVIAMVNEMKLDDNGKIEEELRAYGKETQTCPIRGSLRKISTVSLAPFQRLSNNHLNLGLIKQNDKDDIEEEDNSPLNKLRFSSVNDDDDNSDDDDDDSNIVIDNDDVDEDKASKGKGFNRLVLKTSTALTKVSKNQLLTIPKPLLEKKKSLILTKRNEFKERSNKQIGTMVLATYNKQAFINTITKSCHVASFIFTTDTGFIAFMKKMISKFSNEKYKLIDLFFKREINAEILLTTNKLAIQLSFWNEPESDSAYDSNSDHIHNHHNRRITEDINEEDDDCYLNSILPTKATIKAIIDKKSSFKPLNKEKDKEKTVTFEKSFSNKSDNDKNKIVKLNDNDNDKPTYQSYLFYAYYLEELQTYKQNELSYNEQTINNRIIYFYHEAFILDQIDFPYYRYSTRLRKLPKEELKVYENDYRLEQVKWLIQEIINDLYKNLRGSCSFSLKKGNLLRVSSEQYIRQSNQLTIDLGNDMMSPNTHKTTNILGSNSSSNGAGFLNGKSEGITIDFSRIGKEMKREHKKKLMNISAKKKEDMNQHSNQNEKHVHFNIGNGNVFIHPFTLNENENEDKEKGNDANDISIKRHDRKHSKTTKHITSPITCTFTFNKTFDHPYIINNHKKVVKAPEPLILITQIASKLSAIITITTQRTSILTTILNKDNESFNEITLLICRLQRINLAHLTNQSQQYAFWLNCFNYLIIYGILYTNCFPQCFEHWGKYLTNCLYKIGGYDMSLYEIEHKILNCCNFHHNPITYTDSLTQKFRVFDDNILLNFALSFPIRSDLFNMFQYSNDQFEEELYQTAKTFLKKNIRYDERRKIVNISEYLNLILPDFTKEKYKKYQHYMDAKLYAVLETNGYEAIEINKICWEYSL